MPVRPILSSVDERRRCPVVILISGRGSNLQAIIDETLYRQLPIDIRAVISNNRAARGLARAQQAGLRTQVIDHREFLSRGEFDRALTQAIERCRAELVILAGFMRILGPEFIQRYRGRLINVHPSLLPAFPGLDTHARVLQTGAKVHGATVHFVTDAIDGGPVILQAAVPVQPDDTPESLANRVLKEEHRIYPLAIRWFAGGRLELQGERVLLDGQELMPTS